MPFFYFQYFKYSKYTGAWNKVQHSINRIQAKGNNMESKPYKIAYNRLLKPLHHTNGPVISLYANDCTRGNTYLLLDISRAQNRLFDTLNGKHLNTWNHYIMLTGNNTLKLQDKNGLSNQFNRIGLIENDYQNHPPVGIDNHYQAGFGSGMRANPVFRGKNMRATLGFRGKIHYKIKIMRGNPLFRGKK